MVWYDTAAKIGKSNNLHKPVLRQADKTKWFHGLSCVDSVLSIDIDNVCAGSTVFLYIFLYQPTL